MGTTNIPAIENLFPEVAQFKLADFARIGTDRPTLMIAMTARTGSSHLCSGLSSVLPIGKPTELLNARDTLVWEKKKRGVSTFAELLESYFDESPETIVFKTSWNDFSYFKDKIFGMFPKLKIIYLNRLDVEAQAVSLFKAIVSGHWHDSPDIKRGEKLTENQLMQKFDLPRICRIIGELDKEKSAWEEFFFTHQTLPVRINYESFMSDLPAAVKLVAKAVGYEHIDVACAHSNFSALSDKVNDEWLKILRNYRSGQFYESHKKKCN